MTKIQKRGISASIEELTNDENGKTARLAAKLAYWVISLTEGLAE